MYDFAATVADPLPFDLMQEVILANLNPNTAYFYVRESTDLTNNVQLTTARTFRTGQ